MPASAPAPTPIVPEPKVKAKAKPPVRSLYATQRKKPAPGAAASRGRDE